MSLRISEIFGPTIQGEGALIGEPTVFVRTGGCDFRCSWCDSLHAVDPTYRHTWVDMDTATVWQEIEQLSAGHPLTVSLSGGNPAIQPFGDLIELGQASNYRFALETQGSVARDWFAELDTLVLSPKPPSSGEKMDWAKFDICLLKAGQMPHIVLKIVVFDNDDYVWAKKVAQRYPDLPLYLQPGNHTPPKLDTGPDMRPDRGDDHIDIDGIMDRMQWLIEKTLADKWFDARILPQLHVLIWGNKRGV